MIVFNNINNRETKLGNFENNQEESIKSLKDDSYYCLEFAPESTFLINHELLIVAANAAGKKSIDSGVIVLNNNHLIIQDNLSLKTLFSAQERLIKEESNYERFILKLNGISTACVLYPANHDRSLHFFAIKTQTIDEILIGLPEVTKVFSLTDTETRILKNMVQGMRPKEIALVQGNSLNTVRAHLRTIYAKMQVRSYNEALSKAISLLC